MISAQADPARSMTCDRRYEYNYQEWNIHVLLNLQITKVYMGTLSVVKITPNFYVELKYNGLNRLIFHPVCDIRCDFRSPTLILRYFWTDVYHY